MPLNLQKNVFSHMEIHFLYTMIRKSSSAERNGNYSHPNGYR